MLGPDLPEGRTHSDPEVTMPTAVPTRLVAALLMHSAPIWSQQLLEGKAGEWSSFSTRLELDFSASWLATWRRPAVAYFFLIGVCPPGTSASETPIQGFSNKRDHRPLDAEPNWNSVLSKFTLFWRWSVSHELGKKTYPFRLLVF
jgi:hypothetical protein